MAAKGGAQAAKLALGREQSPIALLVWFYSFLEIHKHFYSLSKPDDALGGRNASLVCNLSHAYHFYDCAPPPRLPSYAGPPCAPGTTHDSFSQMCAYGRWHIACAAYGLGLLPAPLVSYSTGRSR